jgi:septal ring factor EnvC (AmiA/AmiB activator)
MPPPQAPTEAQPSVSTSSTIETAKDRLWEFQLRKENKAILQEIKIAAKDRQKDQAEYERKMKASSGRIDALEAKLADLERLYKEHAHAREKWMEEAAAFKSSMANVLAQHLNEGFTHASLTISQILTK